MASRNGLNPKIRGPKGVGYGRALPAPFGFGKGYVPSATNNASYFLLPTLIGKTWPLEGTIEMWQNIQANKGQREMKIDFDDSTSLYITAYGTPVSTIAAPGRVTTAGQPPGGTYNFNNTYHVAYMWDASNVYAWGNLFPNLTDTQSLAAPINLQIVAAAISGETSGANCTSAKLDEFRIYNKKLSTLELNSNDNGGYGNNPSTTEKLIGWYQFEKFEMLDFSDLQDGSDIRLGIRDMSGYNNHLWPQNMNTDPTSDSYILQQF